MFSPNVYDFRTWSNTYQSMATLTLWVYRRIQRAWATIDLAVEFEGYFSKSRLVLGYYGSIVKACHMAHSYLVVPGTSWEEPL